MSKHQKSELAWNLADYLAAGEEPPARMIVMPEACEGYLMTDEEVEEFIRDSVATIMILRDQGSERTPTVYQSFMDDVKFLVSIGRLEAGEYNELQDLDKYGF